MNFFQMPHEWINGEGIELPDSRILILALLCATLSLSLLRPGAFRLFLAPTTDRSDGAQLPAFMPTTGG
jgi:hypothetical protein